MKPSTAVAGKLATVFYQCLKTKTPYDEVKNRKQMGMQEYTETGTPIEVSNEMIDEDVIQNDTASPNTDLLTVLVENKAI